MSWIALTTTLTAAVVILVAATTAPPYSDGPPSAHTGGFGEAHCGACHFDAPVDDGAGEAMIGAPGSYEPGVTYDLVVTVRHPDLQAAGFQLAARFAAGPRTRRQAGRLEPADRRTQVVDARSGISYASHTASGVSAAEPGTARWVLRWTAPDAGDEVVFHLAANAADADDSEFGDRIYLAEHRVPAGGPTDKR